MTPEEIVARMMEKDQFSQWLGVRVLETGMGKCLLKMTVRKEMLNGFGIAHGGITYSLADSALAFASNSQGPQSVSIETSVSHLVSLREGDEIFAKATSEGQTSKLGHYSVKVFLAGQEDKPVALFKGIVFKTSKNWETSETNKRT